MYIFARICIKNYVVELLIIIKLNILSGDIWFTGTLDENINKNDNDYMNVKSEQPITKKL